MIEAARQLAVIVLVIGAIVLPMFAPLRWAIAGIVAIAAAVALLLKVKLGSDGP